MNNWWRRTILKIGSYRSTNHIEKLTSRDLSCCYTKRGEWREKSKWAEELIFYQIYNTLILPPFGPKEQSSLRNESEHRFSESNFHDMHSLTSFVVWHDKGTAIMMASW